jgi:hypothetical protein
MDTETDVTRQSHWDIAREEFACGHAGHEAVTFMLDSLGRDHYGLHCTRCGVWRSVKKSSLSPSELGAATKRDDRVAVRWKAAFENRAREIWEEQTAERVAAAQAEEEARQVEFEIRSDQRKREYAEFRRTPQWASIRERVLRRANWTCEGCLQFRATQVHHKHYNREFGDEFMFDLIALCRPCHRKLHGIDDQAEDVA